MPLTVDGVEWEFTDAGSGDVLVLVHGLGTDSSAWDELRPLLEGAFRVITVEVPGYSLRSSPDIPPDSLALIAAQLDSFLQQLAVDHYILVGHSLGGVLCLLCAYQFPEQCVGLVLIDTAGFGDGMSPLVSLLASRPALAALGLVHNKSVSEAAANLWSYVSKSAPVAPSVVRAMRNMNPGLSDRRARAVFRQSVQAASEVPPPPENWYRSEWISKLPTLIIWGLNDYITPVWNAGVAASQLHNSTVMIVPGAGHSPHRTHPDTVATAITEFAARGQSGAEASDDGGGVP